MSSKNENSAQLATVATTEATTINSSNKQTKDKDEQHAKKLEKANAKWRRRIWLLTCGRGYKRNKDTIVEVANLMAQFFSQTDVSISESIVALSLLRKKYEAYQNWLLENKPNDYFAFHSNEPITPKTRFLDSNNAADNYLLNELKHYLNYALAIFGWQMSMLDDSCFLCCICPYLSCCRCLRKASCCCCCIGCCKSQKRKRSKSTGAVSPDSGQPSPGADQATTDNLSMNDQSVLDECCSQQSFDLSSDIIEDNCCKCNYAAMNRRLRRHNYDTIYVSYHDDVNQVPYSVCVDHSKRTVVLTLRGSMTMYDAITDMNGAPVQLPIENCPWDWLCHRGMLLAALYVKSQLESKSILERAFKSRPDLNTINYSLVLCGHSLGAGVAALLGILLREKQYPNLKAYLFGAPGGLVTMPVVNYTKQFAVTVFLGNDCIQRVGMAQFERLRYCALYCLKQEKLSKRQIMARFLMPSLLDSSTSEKQPDSSALSPTESGQFEDDELREFALFMDGEKPDFEFNNSTVKFQIQKHVMYVPGKLVHIVKNYSFDSSSDSKTKLCGLLPSSCLSNNEPIYQAIWAENEHFDRIVLADRMMKDHFPNTLMHALKMIFSKTLAADTQTRLLGNSSAPINETTSIITNSSTSATASLKLNYKSIN